MTELIARTYLFVPATRIERVSKALAAGADAVIVDLEDAVAPADKSMARDAAAKGCSNAASVFIRVNGPDTEWFEEDLELCASLGALGVVVPKAETADQLRYVANRLESGAIVLPLVETGPAAMQTRRKSARRRVCRASFSDRSISSSIWVSPAIARRAALFSLRPGAQFELAGLQPPVDGVTVDIERTSTACATMRCTKRLGFGGKLCIHPKQIGPVNECFSPHRDEIAWAQRVVDAAGAARGGAVQVDGKMVDTPVPLRAQEILRESQRAKR